MAGQPVSVSFNENQTRAAFTLYHAKGNSITLAMIETLRSAFEQIAGNPHLKLLTIEGAGADFSFGANIPEHSPGQIGQVLPAMHRLVVEFLELPVVTAAIVRGRCFGGGFELALACDFIFAADGATFGLPEINLGVFPPAAAVLLPWRLGGSHATRAIVTGESRDARAWHTTGLIDLIAPASELNQAVDAWFGKHLAPKSGAALRHAAAAVRSGLLAHVQAHLPRLERLYLDDLMHTADAVEGVTAFLEKRPPQWVDR